MIVIIVIDFLVVLSLVLLGRRSLENALPVFAFILVLVPYESRLVIPGLPDLTTERVAVSTMLCMFLSSRHYVKATHRVPMKRLMFVHVAWVVMSSLLSLSIATSMKQTISQLLEYYTLYYVIIMTVYSVETVYKTIYALLIALSICCVFSVFEVYGSWSVLRIFPPELWTTYDGARDPLYIEWGRGLRVRSTFPHPILFGDALAMGIPLALFLVAGWANGKRRLILWAGVILMFWSIYKTSSRGPWIGLGASLLLLVVLVRNHVRKYVASLALVAAFALLARPGIRSTIQGLYDSTMDSSNPIGSSYEFRSALNRAVREAVQRNPVRATFGYGLGTFRVLGLDIKFLNCVQRWYTCDNNWAAFLYETGYGGVIIVAAILGYPLWMTLRSYRALPRPENYLNGVIFINLATFYFLLFSVAGYGWGQQGFIAWILISLSIAYPKAARAEHQAKRDETGRGTGPQPEGPKAAKWFLENHDADEAKGEWSAIWAR